MSAVAFPRRVSSSSPRPVRLIVSMITLVALVLTTFFTAAPAHAASGRISEVKVTVTDDGSAPAALDGSISNGIVAVGSAVTVAWSISATDLVGGTFSQTLPEGWSWDSASLTALTSNNGVYSSSYVLDGRTLTATMSIPNSSIVSIPGLRAVVSSSAANGSSYTPTLTATDAAGAVLATSPPLTVVGHYGIAGHVSLNGTATTSATTVYDFGAGLEPAYASWASFSVSNGASAGILNARPDAAVTATVTLDGLLPGAVTGPAVVSYDPSTGVLVLRNDPSANLQSNEGSSATAYANFQLWYPASGITLEPQYTTVTGTIDPFTVNGGQTLGSYGTVGGTVTVVEKAPPPPVEEVVVPAKQVSTGYVYDKIGTPDLSAPWWLGWPGSGWRESYSPDANKDYGAAQGADALQSSRFTPPSMGSDFVIGTNVVAYDFWDPSIGQITTIPGAVRLLGTHDAVIDPALYTVQYTNGSTVDGPWYSTVAEAGGVAAVSGVKVALQDGVLKRDTKLNLVVPQKLVGDYGQVLVNAFKWTGEGYGDPITGSTRLTINYADLTTSITANPGSIVSGNPVTFTTNQYVFPEAGTQAPIMSRDLRFTLTFPSVVLSVDSSAAAAAGWNLVSYTAGDLGADGMAGTGDDKNGPVLVFSRPDTLIPTRAAGGLLSSFPVVASTSLKAPHTGGAMRVNADLTMADSLPSGAVAFVNVTQSNTLSMDGRVLHPQIETAPTTVGWTENWYNFTASGITGGAYIMDVLPYDGDSRGSSFSGTATLASARLVGQAAVLSGAELQFTTADPTTIGAVPGSSVEWQKLTGETDLSTVTALRVYLPAMNAGSYGGLEITMNVDGQERGDRYINSASASFAQNSTTLQSPTYRVDVVGGALAGVVWSDDDSDAARGTDEGGVPNVTVELLQDGVVIAAATTDSDGAYAFDGLIAGDYLVQVDPASIDHPSPLQTSGPSGVLDNTSGTISVPMGASFTDLDFGYFLSEHSDLAFTKTAVLAAGATGAAGDVIDYTFVVENTGNTTLTDVRVTDGLAGLSALDYVWPGTAGTLAPGETVTATATYVITQADVDAGSVINTATATGNGRPDAPVEVEGSATVDLVRTSELAFAKSAALAAGATGAVGETIEYAFRVENTGNTTVTDIAIDDALAGLTPLTYTWPAAAGVLAPGEVATATASYVITQADVDAGSVINTATAAGTGPEGGVETEGGATVDLVQNTTLAFAKTGALTAGATGVAGDVIEYGFVVENTGNTTVTDVTISDELAGLSDLVYMWPGQDGVLAPGETLTASANYVITQTDIDAGSVVNTATVTGTGPEGGVDVDGGTTVDLVQDSNLAFTKTGALAAGAAGAVGEVIEYGFVVENTGNTTVTDIAITDPLPGLSEIVYAWPGEVGVLAPGEKATATASYLITQADIDAGSVINTATVDGEGPEGGVQTDGGTTVELEQSSDLTFTKTAALAAGATGVAGDVIEYRFEVQNTGNTTVTDVQIDDQLAGLSAIDYTWPDATGVLAPGERVTATATYTVTQTDVDAGSVVNTATASGTGPEANVEVDGGATLPLGQNSALAFTKTGALAAGATGAVGDVIDYEFVVENIGNTTVTDIVIIDALAGLTEIVYEWPGTVGTLAPGETLTASASYQITQADVDAGEVLNTATVTGAGPESGVEVDGETTVPLAQDSVLTFAKTAALAAGATGAVGDVIVYDFVVENTGNTTVTGVAIRDTLPGLSEIEYAWPGAVGVLAPGAKLTATASYLITQADIDAGAVINTATVSGSAPDAEIEVDGGATVPLGQHSALEFTKLGALEQGATGAVGDRIEYGFVVHNIGNTTVTGVTIADALPGLSDVAFSWPGEVGVLAPGEAVAAVADYAITEADIAAGEVINVATAAGTGPEADLSVDSSVTVTLPRQPGLPEIEEPGLPETGGEHGDGPGSTSVQSGNLAATGLGFGTELAVGIGGGVLLAGALLLLLVARRRRDSEQDAR